MATSAGRVAYGPVQAEDVAGLFDADWQHGGPHALAVNDVVLHKGGVARVIRLSVAVDGEMVELTHAVILAHWRPLALAALRQPQTGSQGHAGWRAEDARKQCNQAK